MAPLPQSNTLRAMLQYTSAQQAHVLEFRLAPGKTSSDAITVANALAQALKATMATSDAFIGLRVSGAGSNLSFPVPFTAVVGTEATGYPVGDQTQFVSWTGRSSGGRRCRVTFFSPHFASDENYRFNRGSTGFVDGVLDVLELAGNGVCAIDGLPVIWNNYANTGYNAYWQREARRT